MLKIKHFLFLLALVLCAGKSSFAADSLILLANKTTLVPGDTLVLTVTSTSTPDAAFGVSLQSAEWRMSEKLSNQPYSLTIPIAASAHGQAKFKAIALLQGSVVASNVISIKIDNPPKNLASIGLNQSDPIVLNSATSTWHLMPTGKLLDGSAIDIDPSDMTFDIRDSKTNNPTLAINIGSDGRISASAPGDYTILMNYAGLTASIPVLVKELPPDLASAFGANGSASSPSSGQVADTSNSANQGSGGGSVDVIFFVVLLIALAVLIYDQRTTRR